MPVERNAFKLGLTLLVILVLLLGVLYFLAPTGGGDMKLFVRFRHDEFTTRLKPGSEVVCGGLTVGSVESLRLEEMTDERSGEEAYYSVATIKVDSGIGLRKDCRIEPSELLLGGMGTLIIKDRGVAEAVEPGMTIDGFSAASLASLTNMMAMQLDPEEPTSLLALIHEQLRADDSGSVVGKVLALLDDLGSVTSSIRNEFDPEQKQVLLGKLHSILDHVNEATGLLRNEMDGAIDVAMIAKIHMGLDTLNSGLLTVVEMLEENREPVAVAVEHVRKTSEILEREIAARIAQQLDTEVPASLMAKVHVAIDHLGRSLEDIKDMTAVGREALVLNKEQMNRMIGNLKETSDHLKAAGKDIRRSPWRLLYQPTVEEAEQANVFDAARSFSEAATHLDDAVTRLQAVTETGGPGGIADDGRLAEILEQLRHTFSTFTKAENSLWEQLKIK